MFEYRKYFLLTCFLMLVVFAYMYFYTARQGVIYIPNEIKLRNTGDRFRPPENIKQKGFLPPKNITQKEFLPSKNKTQIGFLPPKNRIQKGFLVYTSACTIPDLDPRDPSIAKIIENRKPLNCSKNPSVTFQRGNTVIVNREVANKMFGNSSWYCASDRIERVKEKTDSKINFVPNPGKFNESYVLTSEFTRIRCFKSNVAVYHNFYAINTQKPEAEARYRKSFKKHVADNSLKRYYNVLIVGLDSLSRLNFMRHLPKTRAYLLSELGAIDMTGYHKVADNTFLNIVPLTSGKFVPELPYDEARDKHKPFDDYDFIFKNFADAGYRILNAEDLPYGAAFNYIKEGFHRPPADDYFRPITLAMEADKSIWSNQHYCVHDRMEIKIHFEYLYRFMRANNSPKRPYYSFFFQTRITHDYMNRAALADAPNVEFLKRIHKSKYLDDTIMFYLADHGMRFGKIRNTFIGKMSARLPLMYVYLPPSFRREYPELYNNVVTNARRLATPFDVYETLRDILYFNDSVGRPANLSSRGISFFSEIPAARTCRHADIEPHWCACNKEETVPTNDVGIRKAAIVLVNHMNNILKNSSHICAKLRLKKTTKAYKISPIVDMANSYVYYQITVMTSPGGGMFEGTVRYGSSTDVVKIISDLSRTNAYGNTSWCVNLQILKKYCYCSTQQTVPTLRLTV